MQPFEIVPPQDGAKQVATETRAKLAELALKFRPELLVRSSVSKDVLKLWKSCGADCVWSNAPSPVDTLHAALRRIDDGCEPCGHQKSYWLEGAVQSLRKHLHAHGRLHEMADDKAGVGMLLLAMVAPSWTSGQQDMEVRERFGSCDTLLDHDGFESVRMCGLAHVDSWRSRCGVRKLFKRAGVPHQDTAAAGVLIAYFDDAGEPFVAGLLTPHDVLTLRFRRVRLGSYLAELGKEDEWVRNIVNRVKAEQATAQFVVYPNDYLWGRVYADGCAAVESCMSYEPGHWDDMEYFPTQHPIDAYSSAYWGSGDNGLALVVQVDAGGDMLGRGILNTKSGNIVRWYGSVSGGRALSRLAGMDVEDDSALEGSWLALLTDEGTEVPADMAGRFVHPYVDGTRSQGTVEHDTRRVMLLNDGEQDLQDTCGWSYTGEESVYCSYNGRTYRAGAVTRQPITRYCVRTASLEAARAEWVCPITGEWVPEDCRGLVTLDGNRVTAIDAYYINEAIEQGKLTGYRTKSRAGRYTFLTIKQDEAAA